jgi:hypothetical protein
MGLNLVEFGELGPLEAEPIHAQTNADPVEIAGEGAIVSQLSDFTKSFKKCFLRDVFRFMTVAKKIRGSANKAVAMSRDETGESSLVTFPAPGDPLPFLHSRVKANNHLGFHINH